MCPGRRNRYRRGRGNPPRRCDSRLGHSAPAAFQRVAHSCGVWAFIFIFWGVECPPVSLMECSARGFYSELHVCLRRREQGGQRRMASSRPRRRAAEGRAPPDAARPAGPGDSGSQGAQGRPPAVWGSRPASGRGERRWLENLRRPGCLGRARTRWPGRPPSSFPSPPTLTLPPVSGARGLGELTAHTTRPRGHRGLSTVAGG